MLYTFLAIFLYLNAQNISDLPGLIPLKAQRPAASDLVYNGERLRPDEAQKLVEQGKVKDLSYLSPDPTSIVWKDQYILANSNRHNLNTKKEQAFHLVAKEGLNFIDYIPETIGRFGFAVQTLNTNGLVEIYRVRLGLLNHNVILRRNLLRKIGYNVDFTTWTKTLKIKFNGPATKDRFLEQLAKDTLSNQEDESAWLVEEKENEITIRDAVVYQDAEDSFYNLARGDLPVQIIRNRRLFNALLVPYNITNVSSSVNAFSWVPGKVFNGQLSLPYEESNVFSTSLADAKWISRRIAKLDREDWQQIVKSAKYPEPVAKLVTEKLISRRNFIIKYLGLSNEFNQIPINSKISSGPDLVNGKITKTNWPNYVQNYAVGSPTSPLSGDHFKSLLKSKGITNIINNVVSAFNREYVPKTDLGYKIFDHQLDIAAQQFADYITTGEVKDIPFGFWSTNFYDGNIIASREIVTGNYLGTDNLVQLADVVGFNISAGKYIGADGLASRVNFGASAGVFLSRTYAHIKPIKSIKTALKEPFRNLLVPKYKSDLVADISNLFSQSKRYQLNEQAESNLKQQGQSILDQFSQRGRLEELQNGGGNERERKRYLEALNLLNPSKEMIKNEYDLLYNNDLKNISTAFLSKFATGESLVISHNLGGNLSLNPSFSLSSRLRLQSAWSKGLVKLSRLHIYRNAKDEIQIYRDPARFNVSSIYVGLEAYIPIIGFTRTKRKGSAETYFHTIRLSEDMPSEDLEASLKAIVRLIRDSELDAVRAINKPYIIEHKFNEKAYETNFFHWRWLGLNFQDEISLTHPDGYKKSYIRKVSGHRSGKNYEELSTQIINSLLESYTEEEIAIQTTNGSNDPADTMFGESVSEVFAFEAEVLEKENKKIIQDPFVSLTYKWRNWRIQASDMLSIISDINTWFDTDIFADNVLTNTNEIQLSTLAVSIHIYTDGIDFLSSFDPKEIKNILTTYGEFPHYPITPGDLPGSQVRRLRLEREKHRNIMYTKIFTGLFKEYKNAYQNGDVNKTIEYLGRFLTFAERLLPRKHFLNLIGGSQNYYASGQILGFRDQDESEEDSIIGNSVGRIGSDKGRGPLDFIKNKIGISESEMFLYWLLNKI